MKSNPLVPLASSVFPPTQTASTRAAALPFGKQHVEQQNDITTRHWYLKNRPPLLARTMQDSCSYKQLLSLSLFRSLALSLLFREILGLCLLWRRMRRCCLRGAKAAGPARARQRHRRRRRRHGWRCRGHFGHSSSHLNRPERQKKATWHGHASGSGHGLLFSALRRLRSFRRLNGRGHGCRLHRQRLEHA